jgi:hypothetical protein
VRIQLERMHQGLRQDHRDAPPLYALADRQRQILHQPGHHRGLVDEAIPEAGQLPRERFVQSQPRRQKLEAFRQVAGHHWTVSSMLKKIRL